MKLYTTPTFKHRWDKGMRDNGVNGIWREVPSKAPLSLELDMPNVRADSRLFKRIVKEVTKL